LETFPNPARRNYRIRFETADFTSLCPITGQADFATITIEYVPAARCVESKSLKFYLASYRNERAFNEAVANRILDDFVAACAPREIVADRAPGERRIVFAGGGRDWTVKKERDGFRVSGDRVERLATGIDWESPDAAAYFQLLLQKNGVEKELRRLGVRGGDTVRIGSKVLEWTEGGTA
jgi:7-cyano-7-deazaguanine reductase